MIRDIAHITKGQIEILRERLRQRAHTLLREIDQGLHSGALESVPFDAPAATAVAVDVAAIDRDTRELRDIEAALARIAFGSYGICADCGTALPWFRLDAIPEASRCTRCEGRLERRLKKPVTL